MIYREPKERFIHCRICKRRIMKVTDIVQRLSGNGSYVGTCCASEKGETK